ncbi:MAG: prepilin peptidase CpaA [Paracoccaceae bacterium]|jgi:prepilin peptidase CpaA
MLGQISTAGGGYSMTMIPAVVGIALFIATLLWAAVGDADTRMIPNRIIIVLLAGYVLLAPLAGFSLQQIGMSVAAAAVTFSVHLALFWGGAIGGGDAKLIPATALWVGAGEVFSFLLWAAAFGGVLAICALTFRAIPLKTFRAILLNPTNPLPAWFLRLHGRTIGIPLGVSIAAAGVMKIFSSPWVDAFQ